jgi:hypothetical protein
MHRRRAHLAHGLHVNTEQRPAGETGVPAVTTPRTFARYKLLKASGLRAVAKLPGIGRLLHRQAKGANGKLLGNSQQLL